MRTLAVTLGEVGALEGSEQKRDLPGTQGLTGAAGSCGENRLWGRGTGDQGGGYRFR